MEKGNQQIGGEIERRSGWLGTIDVEVFCILDSVNKLAQQRPMHADACTLNGDDAYARELFGVIRYEITNYI